MIDDNLLTPTDFDEFAQTPKPEHLVPDSIEREREREQFRAQLRDGPGAVVITHTDADGLSSAALLVEHVSQSEPRSVVHDVPYATHETADVVVLPVSYNGAYRFKDVVDDLLAEQVRDTPIYISDFALDREDVVPDLEHLVLRENDLTWYDHHQWDDDLVADLEDAGIDVVIDEDECAASLIARELSLFDEPLADLAECTKDIDLWIREDPRSERLNVFASLVEDPWRYIVNVLKHGADLPDEIQAQIDDRLEEQRRLEAKAIENRYVGHVGDQTDYTVAITYTRGGRSSQIGNDLVEKMDHDIAVILKPHGGAGIYTHSNRETFARCHEVADLLGGGGHPTAAGFEISFDSFDELAGYWINRGSEVRLEVLNAIHSVVSDGDRHELEERIDQALDGDVADADDVKDAFRKDGDSDE